jgi:hypothetical protein
LHLSLIREEPLSPLIESWRQFLLSIFQLAFHSISLKLSCSNLLGSGPYCWTFF